MRIGRIVLLSGVSATAASLAVPSAAFALFRANRANTTNIVSAAALSPVSGVTATPKSSTSVLVSWAPPTTQAPSVSYEVLNTTNNTTACAGLSGAQTNCTDNSVFAGQSYSYSVVSYISSTKWTNAPSAVSGTTPDSYAISPASTQTAGLSFNLTVTAQKATSATNGALVTDSGYTGSSITLSGPAASPNGNLPSYGGSSGTLSNTAVTLSSVTFTSGQLTVATVLYNAASTTVTATSGAGGTAVTGNTTFTVQPGPGSLSLSSCSISSPPSTTCPANSAQFNVSKSATFTASVNRSTTDGYGNVLTLSAGTASIAVTANKGSITSPSNSQLSFAASSTSGGSFTYTQSATGNGSITIPLAGWGSYGITPHG